MAVSGSYDDTLSTTRDKVRALIGDTAADAWLLSDDHLDVVVSLTGSLMAAVGFCADELVARFAQQPVKVSSQGELIDFSERIATWRHISAQAKAEQSAANNPNSSPFSFVTATYGEPETDEYAQGTSY
jgi:hypothetical protein